ncbi:glucose-6-phosphate dehydrogenase, partial [Parabacteroides merdae]|nr:glucose-6-phosphate dehydrogenase [Parabacteroides merdae]
SDALEASWRLIDPILHHWKEEGAKNLFFYAPGEDGPIEKAKLGMTPKDCPCQSCQ